MLSRIEVRESFKYGEYFRGGGFESDFTPKRTIIDT
jgi:hypothetical protein